MKLLAIMAAGAIAAGNLRAQEVIHVVIIPSPKTDGGSIGRWLAGIPGPQEQRRQEAEKIALEIPKLREKVREKLQAFQEAPSFMAGVPRVEYGFAKDELARAEQKLQELRLKQ